MKTQLLNDEMAPISINNIVICNLVSSRYAQATEIEKTAWHDQS